MTPGLVEVQYTVSTTTTTTVTRSYSVAVNRASFY